MTEQIQSNLEWINNIKELIILFNREITETNIVSPSAIIDARNLCEMLSQLGRILKKHIDEFKGTWVRTLSLSSKLDFFCTMKGRGFEWEPYLDLVKLLELGNE